MTPAQAYEWLAPKLSHGERQALDVIYAAAGVVKSEHPIGYINKTGMECLVNENRATIWRTPGGDGAAIPVFAGEKG